MQHFIIDECGVIFTITKNWAEILEQIGFDSCPVLLKDFINCVSVTTTFEGYSCNEGEIPELWATTVFDEINFYPPTDSIVEKYSTIQEAKVGHVKWVEKVRGGWYPQDQ